MNYSILVPVYNSEKSLETLVKNVMHCHLLRNTDFELIFVNDGSSDQSWNEIKRLSRAFSFVKGISLFKNCGQQKALYYGLHFCTGNIIVTMDDDLQHDISVLEALVQHMHQGSDLIFGVYDDYGSKGLRALGSKGVGWFFKRHFPELKGHRVSSFRVMRQHVIAPILNKDLTFVYLSAELIPHAKQIGNHHVMRLKRQFGKSGYTFWKCTVIVLKLMLYYGIRVNRLSAKRGIDFEKIIHGWCGKLPDKWYKATKG